MSGSNQAMNLTGMLSQIGGTLGSEIGGQDLMVRNIQNAGRPNVDLGTEKGMMQLMDWQLKNGRTQEANATGGLLKNQQTLSNAAAGEEAGATWLQQVGEAAARVERERQGGAGTAGLQKAVTDYNKVYASAPGAVPAAVRTQAAKITDNVVKPAQAAAADTTANQMVDSVYNMDKMLKDGKLSPQQAGAVRGAREQALGQAGVREAYTARQENEAKAAKAQYEADEKAAIEEGSRAITEAFADGGIKAAADAAAENPKAEAVFRALKEVHDLKTELGTKAATVEANAELGGKIETSINSLPANIPEATRQGFRSALETMEAAPGEVAEVTQKAMLNLLASINTLSTKVTLQAQADAASASRSREDTLTRLETGVSDLTSLKVAASALGLDWNQKLNSMFSGSTPPNEDFELIDQVARDMSKTPEMPRRFQYDGDKIKRDPKTGQPLSNGNYDADRAKYIGATDTAPVIPSENEKLVAEQFNN